MARQEQHAIQIQIVNMYSNHVAVRPVVSREYIIWENVRAKPYPSARFCAPEPSPGHVFMPPSTIELEAHMGQSAQVIGSHITILSMGIDAFGVDIDIIYYWWAKYCGKCAIDLVIVHKGGPPSANYMVIAGGSRCFGTFDMLTLMLNAAGVLNDQFYQELLAAWVARHQGRARLSNPHALFRLVDDRGRNARV